MIKINDTNPLKGYAGIKKKLKAAGTGSASFSDVLSAASSSAPSSPVSNVSGAANVGDLLSLQEVSDEEFARQKALKHGHDLLSSLDALRQSLLLGNVPPDVLRTLEGRLANQRKLTVDPRLHAIIDDIELRAAVELAKYSPLP